ncbi:polysaccharide pyruvyl transferase family protein [Lysinibacillus sp. NPDC093190]|uniref:polysaccharide pyruvyl transferase family protein n=1 Tax=Lysinibacillus sp. NPDC093190 TaxID=3390575 RepID=UPI003D000750
MLISVFDTTICNNNLGNQIIMDSVYQYLYEQNPEAFFVKLPYLEGICNTSINYIKSSDLVFFGGTNSFSSQMETYKQWGIDKDNMDDIKNVISMGMGWWQYQDKADGYTQELLHKVLSHSYYHSVRDSYTKKKLNEIGIDNVIVTGCPTMWELTKEHCKEITEYKSESVLLTLTDYYKHPSDGELINILKKNYKKIYFWIQGSGDLEYIKKFNIDYEIIPPNTNALNKFLDSDISVDYVGTRLHAGIRALQYKKRTIIIGVDNRAIEMGKDFNLNVLDRDHISELDDLINSNFKTNIKLPVDNIMKWKLQFEKNS